ncbi:hypothetical protein KUTeg_023678 [Tegillarca granosa]|uniref:Lipase maturation factor n=1 Tax=Tegillarca granosa TaxID=220873 RepID=A0ABQ9E2C6_TEGGR|nr:hypothetical protein KUTeg_023678 [Tegillarca granosa]
MTGSYLKNTEVDVFTQADPCISKAASAKFIVVDPPSKHLVTMRNDSFCTETTSKCQHQQPVTEVYIMVSLGYTRDVYLWFIAAIYLMAFSSLYVQIPGLYGNKGILPARLVLNKEAKSWDDLLEGQPTLLMLTPKLGLDIELGMDLLCLTGIVISFIAMVFQAARDMVTFTILWMLYLSLYQVGQTFLWFQDILLLETGFLSILVAPFNIQLPKKWKTAFYHHHDNILMWLVKWLLFRLMFASGIVKLTSRCPTWWGLTALTVHFESQVLLQLLIIITGNYNFFNLLTIALCISLLDDSFFCVQKAQRTSSTGRLLNSLMSLVVYGYIGYQTWKLFSLKLITKPSFKIESKLAFSEREFNAWLEKVVPWTVYMGAVSLGYEILTSLVRCFYVENSFIWKIWTGLQCVLFGAVAAGMFALSLVPHTVIHRSSQSIIPPQVFDYKSKLQPFHITNSYGLFRRMTGVGGRPEVVVEGSNYLDKDWKEYEFFYKPGNVSRAPPIVAPHQPRLDWQMWFAALGNYQHNTWFVNMAYRILSGQKEVLELIQHNPFPDQPPKYLRAKLYHYHYTAKDKKNKWFSSKKWWVREEKAEYFPPINKDHHTLTDYLKHAKILPEVKVKSPTTYIGRIISWIRGQIGQPDGFIFDIFVSIHEDFPIYNIELCSLEIEGKVALFFELYVVYNILIPLDIIHEFHFVFYSAVFVSGTDFTIRVIIDNIQLIY